MFIFTNGWGRGVSTYTLISSEFHMRVVYKELAILLGFTRVKFRLWFLLRTRRSQRDVMKPIMFRDNKAI